MLYIVQNNRAYHQEYMYLAAMAARHGRGIDRADIGTTLTDPNIDFATVARGMDGTKMREWTDYEFDRLADQCRFVALLPRRVPAQLERLPQECEIRRQEGEHR